MFSNKTTNEVPVGEGLFRKQGSNVKSWKVRKYSLLSSYTLQYSDPLSNVIKGNMNISNVTVREGARENGKNGGAPKEAIAMDICSFDDSRTLEVVFDAIEEAKQFLLVLHKCTRKHNIPGFCKSQGWTDVLEILARASAPPPAPATIAGNSGSALDTESSGEGTAAAAATASTGGNTGKVDLFGVIDSGNFRKQGSYIASWKVRKYMIKGDAALIYLDPASGDMRGTMSIKFIELYRGNERNVTNSGCTTLAEGDSGYPLDLHIIEGNRKLELVFDSLVDAKRFVRALSLVSTSHNITSFLEANNWSTLDIESSSGDTNPQSIMNDATYRDRKRSINAPLRTGMMIAPLVIYDRVFRVNAPVEMLHSGIFRKFTNLTATTVTRVWNERRFELFSNGILRYYPFTTGELTPVLVEKASFNVEFVLCGVGPEAHIEASGSEDYSLEQGIAIDLYMFADQEEFDQAVVAPPRVSRTLTHPDKLSHIVFDSVADTKGFVEAITKASRSHNIRDFADRVGWPVIKNPEEHVEFNAGSVTDTSAVGVVGDDSIDLDAEFDYEDGISVVDESIASVSVNDGRSRANTNTNTDTNTNTNVSISASVPVSPEQGEESGERLTSSQDVCNSDSSVGATDTEVKDSSNSNVETTRKSALLQKAADAGYVLTKSAAGAASSTVSAVGTVASTTARVANAITDKVVDKNLARPTNTDAAVAIRVLGEGVFRKQGSNVRSWKVRKFVITSDHILWYYDSSGTLKGSMCIKNIRVGDGTPESIMACGIPGPQQVRAMAVNIKSLTDNRTLEVVLETESDCRHFMVYLNRAAINSNVSSFAAKAGWDAQPFETTGAALYMKTPATGTGTGTVAANEGTTPTSSADVAASNRPLPSVPSRSTVDSSKTIKTEPTVTTKNVILALNNMLAIVQLLAKLVCDGNKSCAINIVGKDEPVTGELYGELYYINMIGLVVYDMFVAWFGLMLYVWLCPNVVRVVYLLTYSYGLYSVVLSSKTMEDTGALALNVNAVVSDSASIGSSVSASGVAGVSPGASASAGAVAVDGNPADSGRNWNISKKNQ